VGGFDSTFTHDLLSAGTVWVLGSRLMDVEQELAMMASAATIEIRIKDFMAGYSMG
jgi:hypothetical protein